MFVGELVAIWLIRNYVADFSREKVLFLASYVDERQVSMFEGNVILWTSSLVSRNNSSKGSRPTFFEVLFNGDRTKVSTVELVLSSVKPVQFLDGLLVA
jgi:hypothetical protein